MGVHGWTKLLAERGWLPFTGGRDQPCCTESLWRIDDELTRAAVVAHQANSATNQFQVRRSSPPSAVKNNVSNNSNSSKKQEKKARKEKKTDEDYNEDDFCVSASSSDSVDSDSDSSSTSAGRYADGTTSISFATDRAQRFASRLTVIPTGSTFHIDGHGLLFHLYRVAYARQLKRVIGRKQNHHHHNNGNHNNNKPPCFCPNKQNLTPAQIRSMISTHLSLKLLAEVATEFVHELAGYKKGSNNPTNRQGAATAGVQKNQLICYFDGELRRVYKDQTDQKRQAARPEEWSNLQHYCTQNILPTGYATFCQWERAFPKARLFSVQFMHTLTTLGVQVRHCPEEADPYMAQQATGKPDHYIVGLDSDFCFFSDIAYIPLNTLSVTSHNTSGHGSGPMVTACVIRRRELAEDLKLPDEQAIVEAAILMGNDFIVDPPTAHIDFYNYKGKNTNEDDTTQRQDDDFNASSPRGRGFQLMTSTKKILKYLRQQGAGYRVISQSEDTEEAMRFIRTLYNLGDMSEFPYTAPIDDDDGVDDDDLDEAESSEEEEEDEENCRPAVPADMPLELTTLHPVKDRSVKDAALRCLQAYIDMQKLEGEITSNGRKSKMMITQEHVDVFRQMPVGSAIATTTTNHQNQSHTKGPNSLWRPLWEDVPAAYLIEKVLCTAYKQSSFQSPLIRLYPPWSVFDMLVFHEMLLHHRQDKAATNHGSNGVLSTSLVPSAVVSGKSFLPKDGSEAQQQPEQTTTVVPAVPEEKLKLPVDEHEDTILYTIRNNRVTIIQGETGCGKSSRIPIMLMRDHQTALETGNKVKLFISQPRRIAAKALVERLRAVEPDLRDEIALRMGHGVREYETSQTRAWFVTTGYLVRLLANNVGVFDSVSHLIIDEVHERSVDTDILCLLCRRLLNTNPRIRLVLMSATLAAELYQSYFQVPIPPIKVGSRRFPVKEVFLDDIPKQFSLPNKIRNSVEGLINECNNMKCKRAPSLNYMEKMFSVVTHLAMMVGRGGTSVLIFVPGMNEIVAITEQVEKLFVPGLRFSCFPIHSDIPFEDQMNVFNQSAADEVKIIVATNAAESSLTLPEVDNVICLGLCKQIIYNQTSHRQQLMPAWISRASATQRAGRTGRLRPGTVYRMYTRETFDCHMDAFEPSEMVRIPLDSVILMLKELLSDEEVTNVLMDCLEPPDISTIKRSFQSLHQSHFITTPDDTCEITNLGSFVSALGIDLSLGSMVGLGIQFGVGVEAIEMASILSFPKSPWIMSNPLVHGNEEYNSMVARTFASRCHFDANLFSEPLATMNLLWDYRAATQKLDWCWKYGIMQARIKRLASTCDNLKGRVADFIGISGSELKLDAPPRLMPHSKITILRVIQAWVFHDTMIQCNPASFIRSATDDGLTVDLLKKSDIITEQHLNQVLDPKRHPYVLKQYSEFQQKGEFQVFDEKGFTLKYFVDRGFEQRLISMAVEHGYDLVWCWDKSDAMAVYVMEQTYSSPDFAAVITDKLTERLHDTLLEAKEYVSKARRGLHERACGRWTICECQQEEDSEIIIQRYSTAHRPAKMGKAKLKTLQFHLEEYVKSHPDMKALYCEFAINKKDAQKLKFNLISKGQVQKISKTDICDIFASSVIKTVDRIHQGTQQIFFPAEPNKPLFDGSKEADSSWDRPLFPCIPEGARLLSALASGRRNAHVVKLLPLVSPDQHEQIEEIETVDIYPETSQSKITGRWKRLSTESLVYVQENSIPASALPIRLNGTLFCCCSNTLEVKGGGLRVEGLTLLPPGRLFLMLCRLSFGLFQEQNLIDGSLVERTITWIAQELEGLSIPQAVLDEWRRRIEMAVDFHESVSELGEELACFPDKVAALLNVFNGLDGFECGAWASLYDNPFIQDKLNKLEKGVDEFGRSGRGKRKDSNSRNKKIPVISAGDANIRIQRQASQADSTQADSDRELYLLVQEMQNLVLQEEANRNRKGGKKKNKSKKAVADNQQNERSIARAGYARIEMQRQESQVESTKSDSERELDLIIQETSHLGLEGEPKANPSRNRRKKKNKNGKVVADNQNVPMASAGYARIEMQRQESQAESAKSDSDREIELILQATNHLGVEQEEPQANPNRNGRKKKNGNSVADRKETSDGVKGNRKPRRKKAPLP